ncbi:MAG TPA: alpha/beta hydrolase [Mycobacterium sp.]|jgi:alpha-beta hydrolase superfamily lysophospholipase
MSRAREDQSVWEPDVLTGYAKRTLSLGLDPDGEGEIVATVIRKKDPATAHRAVVAVHGYTDYFFNAEVADYFTGRGFAFYAIDLRKCGRSWREGQTPHFTTDLACYDVELQRAAALIADETGGASLLVYGHSAGGLIVTLWLDRMRREARSSGVTGLVLNSPFFDVRGPAVLRAAVSSATTGAVSRLGRRRVLRRTGAGGYGTSLHRDHGGEFDYNLAWKPLGGFPVTVGWIHAIRRGQARLHRGLDVGVPSLILRSDKSVAESRDAAAMQRGDAVLDVAQIARWAGCVGNRTTVVPITDAKHDVFLSLAEPRQTAYHELSAWLDWYTAHTSPDNTDARRMS